MVVVAYTLEDGEPAAVLQFEVGHCFFHAGPKVGAVESNVTKGHSVSVGVAAFGVPPVEAGNHCRYRFCLVSVNLGSGLALGITDHNHGEFILHSLWFQSEVVTVYLIMVEGRGRIEQGQMCACIKGNFKFRRHTHVNVPSIAASLELVNSVGVRDSIGIAVGYRNIGNARTGYCILNKTASIYALGYGSSVDDIYRQVFFGGMA